MEVVMIGSTPYDSYASLAQADAYLAASLQAGADWSDATGDTKGMSLVTMTRVLDRQRWLDAYDTQAERAALADAGNYDVRHATIEGALALLQGSDLQSEATTAQKLQAIKAGSVSLTYFRGAEGAPRRFPVIVQELLRDYLAGTSLGNYGTATGIDGTSSTDDSFDHTEGV